MCRNDQVIRQWFLLQALEKPGGATIDKLAKFLSEDYACHPGTIRRGLEVHERRSPPGWRTGRDPGCHFH